MNGGRLSVPVVFWGIINRGGEQAAQHSQAIHSMFAHVPGLKVVMPASPYDAKGLMISAIKDENPVVFIDDRWLYGTEGIVPKDPYEVPIGEARIRRSGKDVTIAATSYMVELVLDASDHLSERGLDVEVIDLRTIKPLDKATLINSVKKTGKLVVADGGWKSFGVSAEIEAVVVEEAFRELKAPPIRVTLPDVPAPAARSLEKAYYPTKENVITAVLNCINYR